METEVVHHWRRRGGHAGRDKRAAGPPAPPALRLVVGAGDDERYELTSERRAENEQHAADRVAVEGGRTLRLVLGAPIIIWSFVGIPALGLLALVTVLGAARLGGGAP